MKTDSLSLHAPLRHMLGEAEIRGARVDTSTLKMHLGNDDLNCEYSGGERFF